MADAGRNSTGAADRQERQQRDRQAVQPGAAGGETEGAGPQEAREEAQHTHGKTRKHSSGEI
jgi:hypothetical protein